MINRHNLIAVSIIGYAGQVIPPCISTHTDDILKSHKCSRILMLIDIPDHLPDLRTVSRLFMRRLNRAGKTISAKAKKIVKTKEIA